MRAMTGSGEALLNSFKISAMLMGNPPWGKNLPANYPNSLTLANTRDSFKALVLITNHPQDFHESSLSEKGEENE
jgi:hypothetical protein